MIAVYILAAILIFGVLIAVHEFGHFAAAKLCGVRVNEFSIGMGPCIFNRVRGETQYSLRLLPIGGYCAMEGEDGNSDDEAALGRQGFWKQFIIFAAGAAMNFLTGLLIMLALYAGLSEIRVPQLAGAAAEFEEVNGVALEEGDLLWAIDGRRVYVYNDVNLLLSLGKGQPIELTVVRDGEKITIADVPRQTYTGTTGDSYQGYGIYIASNAFVEATPALKLKTAWLNTLDFARIVWLSLGMLVSGEAGMDDIGGPVAIVDTIAGVGMESETPLIAVQNIVYFAALIAVNLAVMNLLPIPALDGGRIFFLVINALALRLFRRRVPEKYEAAINMGGFVVLMGFMLLVTFHDVFKLFQ